MSLRISSFSSSLPIHLGPACRATCLEDQSANLFVQLKGAKRFILFPPLVGAAALRPYPIVHPRDRCAQLELGSASRLAHGQGLEVLLEEGDGLFLPRRLGGLGRLWKRKMAGKVDEHRGK